MRKKHVNGHYFYRTLLISTIISILITSVVVVVRYQDRYQKHMSHIRDNQDLVFEYVDAGVQQRLSNMETQANQLLNSEVFISARSSGAIGQLDALTLSDNATGRLVFMNLDGSPTIEWNFDQGEATVSSVPRSESLSRGSLNKISEFGVNALLLPDRITYSGGQLEAMQMVVPVMDHGERIGYLGLVIPSNQLFNQVHLIGDNTLERLMVIDGDQHVYYADFPMEPSDGFEIGEALSDRGETFSDMGLISYRTLRPSRESDIALPEALYLVTVIPYEAFMASSQEIIRDLVAFGIALFVTLMIVALMTSSRLGKFYSSHQMMEHYCTYDSLTGAYNRRPGIDFLSKVHQMSLRSSQTMAFAYFDVNDLKKINDRKGHQAGDVAIKKVVDKVMEFVGRSDMVIRMGGDEFLAALSDTTVNQADDLFQRIKEALSQIGDEGIGISLGIADTEESGFEELDQMIANANHRRKKDKKKEMVDRMIDRLELEEK